MLWSCDNDLIGVAVTDREHPCTAALAENGSCQPVETPVGHALLDTWIADDMHPVPDLKSLDDAGARWQTAFSQIFLEFIPCFLSWTIVMCHFLLSLLCSFNLRYVEAGDASCFVQDLGKTRTGSA